MANRPNTHNTQHTPYTTHTTPRTHNLRHATPHNRTTQHHTPHHTHHAPRAPCAQHAQHARHTQTSSTHSSRHDLCTHLSTTATTCTPAHTPTSVSLPPSPTPPSLTFKPSFFSFSSFLLPLLNRYPKTEIHNLSLFISRIKFRPLVRWNTHPRVRGNRLRSLIEHLH